MVVVGGGIVRFACLDLDISGQHSEEKEERRKRNVGRVVGCGREQDGGPGESCGEY